jgi:hypothetical protein
LLFNRLLILKFIQHLELETHERKPRASLLTSFGLVGVSAVGGVMATKETSCWPGYQRVPGQAKGTKGSCSKKAASKSTVSEKKFQQKRKQQIDGWQNKHTGSPRRAAQHLSAPGKGKVAAKKQSARNKSR